MIGFLLYRLLFARTRLFAILILQQIGSTPLSQMEMNPATFPEI